MYKRDSNFHLSSHSKHYFLLNPATIAGLTHALSNRLQFMIKPMLTCGRVAYQQWGFLLRLLQGQLSRTYGSCVRLDSFQSLCATGSWIWTSSVHEARHSANMVSTQPLYSVCSLPHRAAFHLTHLLPFSHSQSLNLLYVMFYGRLTNTDRLIWFKVSYAHV